MNAGRRLLYFFGALAVAMALGVAQQRWTTALAAKPAGNKKIRPYRPLPTVTIGRMELVNAALEFFDATVRSFEGIVRGAGSVGSALSGATEGVGKAIKGLFGK